MPSIQMGEDISTYYSDPMQHTVTVEYYSDSYSNDTACGKLLTQLHKDLQRLDFPYYFVQIVTTNANIQQELVELHKLYSNEPNPIEYNVVEGKFDKQVYKGDTVCVFPWIHKYVNPQGLVMPCCIGDEKYPLGNIRESSLSDISTATIQQQMLVGQRPDACSTCWYKEDAGLSSARQIVNKRFAQYREQKNFALRHVDIRLSNVCNLKCRMCSGKFSNRIAQEEIKLYGSTKYKDEVLSKDLVHKQLQYIEDNINTIHSVYFAGGEPLINEEHYSILDLLIKHNKTDIRIDYNTNFSLLSFKKFDVLEYWQQFSNINVGASIDLIGAQSNYVRNGVEYEVLEQNYHAIKDLPNINFNISSVLSLYNIFNLPALQKRWLDLGLDCNNIVFDPLVIPQEQSIAVLPNKYKQKAKQVIMSHIDYLEDFSGSKSLITHWQQALEFMTNNHMYLLSEFFRLNDDKDRYRNQRFEDYFPEYKDLRNYA